MADMDYLESKPLGLVVGSSYDGSNSSFSFDEKHILTEMSKPPKNKRMQVRDFHEMRIGQTITAYH